MVILLNEDGQVNALLRSKKREDLNRVPLASSRYGPEHRFARLRLGDSGPEAQMGPKRLALRGIEFVGACLRISEGVQ